MKKIIEGGISEWEFVLTNILGHTIEKQWYPN